MARTTSARRYADAAFEIALRDGSIDAWRDGLAAVAAAVVIPEVEHFAQNPSIPIEARRAVIERAAGGELAGPVRNLVTLLLQRRRADLAPRVADEFQRHLDRRAGLTRASVTSAAALAPDAVSALRDRLVGITGGPVEITVRVDAALLGGLVVRFGDRLIDGSVRGRLERLRTQLVSGAL
jgi:F-type H+-transporting ATPase subunit delta